MIKTKIGILLAASCLVLTAGCAKREKSAIVPPLPTPAEAVETAAPTPTPVPTPTPTPKNLLPPLPDVDINSWEFLYAGPHCGVGRYHPHVGNFEGQYLDERCIDAANEFMAAARNSGFEVYACTAYRNWEYTTFWYEQEMFKYGEFDYEYNHFLPGASYEAAKHGFAAGCSEHSTGLAFDITDESVYWADMNYSNVHDETVAGTPVCKWMDEHCAEYGFIVRSPADKAEVYGMACYPGHYRYVGKEAAKYIMDNHLCLEEFLALYGKTFRGVNYVNEYTLRAQ